MATKRTGTGVSAAFRFTSTKSQVWSETRGNGVGFFSGMRCRKRVPRQRRGVPPQKPRSTSTAASLMEVGSAARGTPCRPFSRSCRDGSPVERKFRILIVTSPKLIFHWQGGRHRMQTAVIAKVRELIHDARETAAVCFRRGRPSIRSERVAMILFLGANRAGWRSADAAKKHRRVAPRLKRRQFFTESAISRRSFFCMRSDSARAADGSRREGDIGSALWRSCRGWKRPCGSTLSRYSWKGFSFLHPTWRSLSPIP